EAPAGRRLTYAVRSAGRGRAEGQSSSGLLERALGDGHGSLGLRGEWAHLPQAFLVLFGEPCLGVGPAELDEPAQQLGGEEERAEQLTVERAVPAGHEAPEQRQVAVAQQA